MSFRKFKARLPTLELDTVPFDFDFTAASTQQRLQTVVGMIDGTLRLYTAKSAEALHAEHSAMERRRVADRKMAADIERKALEHRREQEEDLDIDVEFGNEDRYDDAGGDDDDDDSESEDEDRKVVDRFELDWAIQASSTSVRGIALADGARRAAVVGGDSSFSLVDLETAKFIFRKKQVSKHPFERIKVGC